MNELMFYSGMVFTVFFFITSIIYFFKGNIKEAFRYYFKIQKSNKKIKKSVVSKNVLKEETDIIKVSNSINQEATSIISIAENYATTLLDAEDSTQLLNIEDNTQLLDIKDK